jgi:hypothetical protein
VNAEEVALPLASVVSASVAVPFAKVPLAPEPGAVNVTVAPLVGDPPVVTVATSDEANAVPTTVLCGVPPVAAIATTGGGGGGGGVLVLLHAMSAATMATAISKKIDWRNFIAFLRSLQLSHGFPRPD